MTDPIRLPAREPGASQCAARERLRHRVVGADRRRRAASATAMPAFAEPVASKRPQPRRLRRRRRARSRRPWSASGQDRSRAGCPTTACRLMACDDLPDDDLQRLLPPLRQQSARRRRCPRRRQRRQPDQPRRGMSAGLRLLHLRGRLCRHQQPRRRGRHRVHGRHRRRHRARRQADRHRPAHRSRVLKVDDGNDFTYVEASPIDASRVGDWVVAVGNPFGLGGTVTAGIVSARGRDIGAGPYDDFLQIDAAVNRGNSGGPAFNLNGEVVGVNTAIFSPSGGNVGIAFAIPASTVQEVVDDLIEDGIGHARLARRADPAGDRRTSPTALGLEDARARWSPRRRPTARPEGRHQGRRRHHRGRRQGGRRTRRSCRETIASIEPGTKVDADRAARRQARRPSRSRSAS